MKKMKDEIWRDVLGYEGSYQVSNFGKVKSFIRYNGTSERILKQNKNNRGYFYVGLFKNNKGKNVRVHRLVAEAFIKNPQNKRTVNHINGIKTDNRLSNLEWATMSENQKHAFANGLNCAKGENNGKQKLTEKQVIEIRKLCAQGMKYKDIISKMGLNVLPQAISEITTRRTWPHI